MKFIHFVLLLSLCIALVSAAVAPSTSPPSGNVCAEQHRVVGSCRGMLRRWTFNKDTKKCEEFNYGGCDGTNNNFRTKEKCEETCGVCAEQPKVVGSCRGMLRRWSFNKDTKKCEQFNYGGCDGNSNNFRTKEKCEEACGGAVHKK